MKKKRKNRKDRPPLPYNWVVAQDTDNVRCAIIEMPQSGNENPRVIARGLTFDDARMICDAVNNKWIDDTNLEMADEYIEELKRGKNELMLMVQEIIAVIGDPADWAEFKAGMESENLLKELLKAVYKVYEKLKKKELS